MCTRPHTHTHVYIYIYIYIYIERERERERETAAIVNKAEKCHSAMVGIKNWKT